MIELNKICNLVTSQTNKKLIGIIRNGLTAGTVNIINENTVLSNNSHYLENNSLVHSLD